MGHPRSNGICFDKLATNGSTKPLQSAWLNRAYCYVALMVLTGFSKLKYTQSFLPTWPKRLAAEETGINSAIRGPLTP